MKVSKKTYHKDNLRADLINAAWAMIRENGHESISIRKLAQEVGVSSAAPYHHFSDRRALLLAVALEGYRALYEDFAPKKESSELAPEEQLRNVCRSFLEFAAKNARLLMLMYESELTRPVMDVQIQSAQRKGYVILHNAIRSLVPDLLDEDLGIRITAFWSTIYGFAALRSLGMIKADVDYEEPYSDELAEAIARQAIRAARC